MIRDVHLDPDLDFFPIPDPGSRRSKRHRIPDPQHCLFGFDLFDHFLDTDPKQN